MTLEAWLDETPGETRAIVARDGRFERLLIHRDDDRAAARLGARSIGRVVGVDPGLGLAFVDLDGAAPHGVLAFKGKATLVVGAAVEVEVTAEARERKGPTLRLIGPGTGEPRLLASGADARAWLAAWAPGVAAIEGAAAIQAGWDAEDEALTAAAAIADLHLDLSVERTRALVAVDVDLAETAGRDGRAVRDRANRAAIVHAARLIRLKAWGGLVAIDLLGAGHDGEALSRLTRTAFADGDDAPVVGPVSRFGLMQLTLPWRRTPVEEMLKPTTRTRAQALARRMRHALLTDTARPCVTLAACPADAAAASSLVQALGPRAALVADAGLAPGDAVFRD